MLSVVKSVDKEKRDFRKSIDIKRRFLYYVSINRNKSGG